MYLKINADDYGMTKGITDKILECVDHGAVNSVSILPNGLAFEYAMEEYKKRKNLNLNIHINLVEGKAIAPSNKIFFLVNENGFFKNSFFFLLVKSIFFNKRKRRILEDQIKTECELQIRKVVENVKSGKNVNLDSHRHFHMIPAVLNVIINLTGNRLQSVRLPLEPFFGFIRSFKNFIQYFNINMIKHLVLKILAGYNLKKLIEKKIFFPKYFIGILFPGNKDLYSIEKLLAKLPVQSTVEILFHPGSGSREEKILLQEKARFAEFYFSPEREQESCILKSNAMKQITHLYGRK